MSFEFEKGRLHFQVSTVTVFLERKDEKKVTKTIVLEEKVVTIFASSSKKFCMYGILLY